MTFSVFTSIHWCPVPFVFISRFKSEIMHWYNILNIVILHPEAAYPDWWSYDSFSQSRLVSASKLFYNNSTTVYCQFIQIAVDNR
jgi:hypothetical protein